VEKIDLFFIYKTLNSLNDEGAGFGYDTNKVSVINSKNEVFNYDLKKKSAVAKDIFNHII